MGLFNALTCALGAAPVKVWTQAASGSIYDDETATLLADQGFLVPENLSEVQVLDHWRASMAYDVTHLTYFISPTKACNMACSYCVHRQKTRSENMTQQTVLSVLEFIIKDIEAKRPQSVKLDFGGSEALMNFKAVLQMSQNLSFFCRGRGIDFKLSLITNGLALTPEIIIALKPYGLTRVRTTISGPADIHNRLRPAKSGGDTFETILNNLTSIKGLVEIGLAGQYDPSAEDYLRFPELLDELSERGLKDTVTEVAFGPIYPTAGGEKDYKLESLKACQFSETNPWRRVWLENQIIKKGFKTYEGPPSNRCLANYRNTMVIDSDGAITSCPSLMDHADSRYGHVDSGVDFRLEAELSARPLPKKCHTDCAIAPLCDGGCRLGALIETGDFNGIHCLKDTFDILIRAYIRRNLENYDSFDNWSAEFSPNRF